jgi:hypothetical protein
VPSLKAFKDDVLHIGETLVAIATETERTAERFRHKMALLDSTVRYHRFNVVRGLENIGLEEARLKRWRQRRGGTQADASVCRQHCR